MLFQSLSFTLIFLPITIAGLTFANAVSRTFFLATLSFASLVFYAFHVPSYTFLLIGSAIFNYTIAGYIGGGQRHLLFVAAIVVNVALLAFFKYTGFIADNISLAINQKISAPEILLPLAMSFITFEQIAFLHDIHHKRLKRGTAIQYLTFITFFPKLIAGPIIRYSEMYSQLLKTTISSQNIATGFTIFSFGLLKKTLLADYFGNISDVSYSHVELTGAISVSTAWAGFLAYPLQIFFDFSAYSEMAIGIAWMLGYRLPLNFNSPYKATSIIEFWRRWHITLSAVLRDYIYIPLGGNKLGNFRRFENLMLVMLVGGLWHGAGWTFIIWGALHGLFLIANHLFLGADRSSPTTRFLRLNFISHALTISAVVITWVYFRSPDIMSANFMFQALFNLPPQQILEEITSLGAQGWGLLIGWLWCLTMPNLAELLGFKLDRERVDWSNIGPIPTANWPLTICGALSFLISLTLISKGDPVAFIYFQF